MFWLRPMLTPIQWLTIVVSMILGALAAGLYGVLHDQITYSIAPEYFTHMKFEQFHAAEWGLPPRLAVALIGFKATWALGAAVGLVFSRMVIVSFTKIDGCRKFAIACGLVFASSAFAALGAGIYTKMQPPAKRQRTLEEWTDYQSVYDLTNLDGFVRVAEIHRSSYLGAAAGVALGAGYLSVLIWRRGVRPV